MKTIYILRLNNKKYLERLIRNHICFVKISYFCDYCLLYVDEENLKRIEKYFKMYDIYLYDKKGYGKFKDFLLQYRLFLFSVFCGIIMIYFLSNIIFDIKIMTNKSELIKIIKKELDENGLSRYRLVKTFDQKEIIKEKILNNYKDKIEWLEIERSGTKYYIHVLERIINNSKEDLTPRNIVSKKNAVILEIKAENGEIIRKINDYVNKGDVIISGLITKKDEVKDIVKAKGRVFGETWYNVKVELPRTYKIKKNTGNTYHTISLNIFNKRINFGNRYFEYEYNDISLLENNLLPLSINYTEVREVKNDTYFYTYQDAQEVALRLAREKLMSSLDKDSKILLQKKLKLYEENSTIIIEVFFKVYEEITDYELIVNNE